MKKKSLIDTLKATRKANVITAPAKNEGTSSRKSARRAVALKKSSMRAGKLAPKM